MSGFHLDDDMSQTLVIAVTQSGSYNMVKFHDEFYVAYSMPNAKEDELKNVILYFIQETVAPARVAGEILLVQRKDSGVWLYPTGWADVGYSAAEVAIKEVHEETGIIAEPVALMGVVDGMRMGFSRFGMYMLLFHMNATGGELNGHPLETGDVGWFAADALPSPVAGAQWWGPMAFDAINGVKSHATFDSPRDQMWRGDTDAH